MNAILIRRIPRTGGSRREPDIAFDEEELFRGDLDDAIAAAVAIPANDRSWLSLVTDVGTFTPQEFETLASGAAFADVDLVHGSILIRVTAAALNHLRGALPLPIPAMDVISDHLDALNVVVRRKQKAGQIIWENERRIVVIDAADLA